MIREWRNEEECLSLRLNNCDFINLFTFFRAQIIYSRIMQYAFIFRGPLFMRTDM